MGSAYRRFTRESRDEAVTLVISAGRLVATIANSNDTSRRWVRVLSLFLRSPVAGHSTRREPLEAAT
jgi:transposase-like protein